MLTFDRLHTCYTGGNRDWWGTYKFKILYSQQEMLSYIPVKSGQISLTIHHIKRSDVQIQFWSNIFRTQIPIGIMVLNFHSNTSLNES